MHFAGRKRGARRGKKGSAVSIADTFGLLNSMKRELKETADGSCFLQSWSSGSFLFSSAPQQRALLLVVP